MLMKYAAIAALSGAFLICAPARAADAERGVSLYKQKDYNGAVSELQAALNADAASNRNARYYLGLSLIELQRYADADAQLKQLDSKEGATSPGPAEVKVALARAAMGLKDLDRAQQYLDQARAADSKNPEISLRLGELALQRKQYDAAAKELEQSIELDPKQAYAHYYLGIAYSNLRRPDKMVEQFELFRKLAPEAPEIRKVEALLQSVRR